MSNPGGGTLVSMAKQADMLPVVVDMPLVAPTRHGLFDVVDWVEEAIPRWLASGVQPRIFNIGGLDSSGVWSADWCSPEPASGDELVEKLAQRPDLPDPFLPVTVYATDEALCGRSTDPREVADVHKRAAQYYALNEQGWFEAAFAARMLADADAAGGPAVVDGFVDAVGYLEQALGDARMPGVLHCRCGWAAHAAAAHNVAIRDASGDYFSPLGHRWVFGSGYDGVLANTLIATTAKLVGFRNPITTHQTD
ncbi:MAG TPA: hypothetical protein VMU34_02720, partial [Mycobacterium sp.]|nr:hypothetical protein [Mycobacterium sp.]